MFQSIPNNSTSLRRSLMFSCLGAVLFLLSFAASGCSDSEVGCSTDEDCRQGRICVKGKCGTPFEFGVDVGQADASGDVTEADGCVPRDCAGQCGIVPDGCGQSLVCDDCPDMAVDGPPLLDRDRDGVPDASDNCPDDSNPDQEDLDGDQIGDECDTDYDGDSISNGEDNCPWDANPGQEDSDGDGEGDVCDDTIVPPDMAPDMIDPPDMAPDMVPDMAVDTGVDVGPDATPDASVDMGPVVVGPQIRVTPGASVAFGTEIVNQSTTQNLLVENIGDADLTITSLDLRYRPSNAFDVSPVVDSMNPVVLPPGGQANYTVTFAPTFSSQFNNDIDIESNDADDSLVRLDLTGYGRSATSDSCVYRTPREYDFGAVAPGGMATMTINVSNCSTTETSTVTAVSLLNQPTGGSFSFTTSKMVPFSLAVGATETITVTFNSASLQDVQDILEIRTDAVTGTRLETELLGSGGGCAEAKAQIENASDPDDELGTKRVPIVLGSSSNPGEIASFDGSESTSPSGLTGYQWSIVSKPPTSTAAIVGDTLEVATLTPDVAGSYEIELAVSDLASGQAGCTTSNVRLVALAGPPELVAAVSWQADHDLDLHLVQSDANGMFTFGDPDNDAHWNNTEPDWGQTGDETDDAFFYVDDTDGYGPERIALARLDPTKKYRIGVQYSRRDGNWPRDWDTDLTMDLSTASVTSSQMLTHRFNVNDEGDIWVVYEIDGATAAVTTVDMVQP